MKKLFMILIATTIVVLTGCGGNWAAEVNQQREAETARLQSTYAKVINKLEMSEGNFQDLRRIVLYNVRMDTTVVVVEGHAHIKIDKDGDVEIVIRTGEKSYLRHYLGKQPDCTYYSIQLEPTDNVDDHKYKIYWNPKLWMPEFTRDPNLN